MSERPISHATSRNRDAPTVNSAGLGRPLFQIERTPNDLSNDDAAAGDDQRPHQLVGGHNFGRPPWRVGGIAVVAHRGIFGHSLVEQARQTILANDVGEHRGGEYQVVVAEAPVRAGTPLVPDAKPTRFMNPGSKNKYIVSNRTRIGAAVQRENAGNRQQNGNHGADVVALAHHDHRVGQQSRRGHDQVVERRRGAEDGERPTAVWAARRSSAPPHAAKTVETIENHLHRLVVIGPHDRHAEFAEVAAELEIRADGSRR